jgi:hypothetical protein
MDPRVVSASTRVFDALLSAHDAPHVRGAQLPVNSCKSEKSTPISTFAACLPLAHPGRPRAAGGEPGPRKESRDRGNRPPRISIRVSPSHAAVAQLPVNNRPETGTPRHSSFSTPTGWFFALSCPGAAQRTQISLRNLRTLDCVAVRCRPGTVPVRGGPGSAMHHSLPLALRRIRDTRTSTHSSPLFTCQTASLLRSRGAISASGFCIFASLTRKEGGRSAERRAGAAAPVGHALMRQDARERAYDAARQAPSEAPCVP